MEKFAKRIVGSRSRPEKKHDLSLVVSSPDDIASDDAKQVNPGLKDQSRPSSQSRSVTLNSLASADSYFDSVFERLRCAVLIIDTELKVIWQNQAAVRLLSAGDLLSDTSGYLRAVDANEAIRLRSYLLGMLECKDRSEEMPGISLKCIDTDRFCEIVACPVNADRGSASEALSSACVVFVSDPQQPTSIPAPLLKSMFSLTTCESRLAEALLNGRSLEQFADEVHVSLNTTRTHLKSIFRKTDTSSQASLVSLLARLVPPLTTG